LLQSGVELRSLERDRFRQAAELLLDPALGRCPGDELSTGLSPSSREWFRLQLNQGLARASEPGVARASSCACSTQCSTAPQAVAVPAPALQWVLRIKPFTLLVIGQTRARPALVLLADGDTTSAGRRPACSRPLCGVKVSQISSPRSGAFTTLPRRLLRPSRIPRVGSRL
jgi:hypothetical protein